MRALLFAIVLVVVIAVVGFGWRPGVAPSGTLVPTESETPVGTTGRIDIEKARERGAQAGEKAAEVAAAIQETVTEAGITSKVTAKMALDDLVKARNVGVSTEGATVTLTGRVSSNTERERAVRLAQETDGVARVIDRLEVK